MFPTLTVYLAPLFVVLAIASAALSAASPPSRHVAVLDNNNDTDERLRMWSPTFTGYVNTYSQRINSSTLSSSQS